MLNDTGLNHDAAPEFGPPAIRRERGAVTVDAGVQNSYYSKTDVTLPEADRQLYKFLARDGRSPHQSWSGWILPTKNEDGTWTPGDWVEEPGNLVTCQKGLHLAYILDTRNGNSGPGETRSFAGNWESDRCFEVEVEGPVLFSPTNQKYVAHRVRLVREIEQWPLYLATRRSQHFPNQVEQEAIDDYLFERAWPDLVEKLRKRGHTTLARKFSPMKKLPVAQRREALRVEAAKLQAQVDIAKAQFGVEEAKRYLQLVKDRAAGKTKLGFEKRFFRASRSISRVYKQIRAVGEMSRVYLESIVDLRFGATPHSYSEKDYKIRRSEPYKAALKAEQEAMAAFTATLKANRKEGLTFDTLFPKEAA